MKNKVVSAADIGTAIRKKRKEDGLTLADAASVTDFCPILKTEKNGADG